MNSENINFLKRELDNVNILFGKKEFDLVIKKCKSLLTNNSNQPIIYNFIGLSYLELNENNKALEIFLSANKKLSNEASILCNTGIVYKRLGQLTNAKKYFSKALDINPKHFQSHINLGHIENNLNHSELATTHYLNAYNLNNNSQEVLTYYILSLSAQGKFDKAKEIILELNNKFPKNTKSYQLYSKIHKYELDDPHQQSMLKKINNSDLANEDLSNLHFALAKSYYDQKNTEEFVKHTIKANDIKFKTFVNYDFKLEEKKFKQIKESFTNLKTENEIEDIGKNLIFIVGLPRSGTTLLHQIISSHSKTFGAEESDIITDFFNDKFNNKTSLLEFFSNEFNTKEKRSKLANEILSKYKMYDRDKIIVDKMPFNFRWIGFIKILFPQAKIIHSNRNPSDSAFSIYRNLFEGPEMGWAYNQNYLTKYVALYNDLMSFWKQKLGNFIYESHYEKLVSDQINETKSILKFCNLNFEESCINYTDNKIPSKTVSVFQVRDKVYKSSLNLSDKYLDYFTFLNKIKKRPL